MSEIFDHGTRKYLEISCCCDTMKQHIQKPHAVFGRDTTFTVYNGKLFTDFSGDEYGDIEVSFCPVCGTKLIIEASK